MKPVKLVSIARQHRSNVTAIPRDELLHFYRLSALVPDLKKSLGRYAKTFQR